MCLMQEEERREKRRPSYGQDVKVLLKDVTQLSLTSIGVIQDQQIHHTAPIR